MRPRHAKWHILQGPRPEVVLSFSTWLLSTENTLLTAWCGTKLGAEVMYLERVRICSHHRWCSEQTCSGDGYPCCDCSLHLFHQGQGGRQVTPFQLQESHDSQEFMSSGENSPKKALRPQRRERCNATKAGPCRSCYLSMTAVPSVEVGPSDTGTQPSSSISRHGFPWACSLPNSPATPSTCTLMCYCWHHLLSCRIKETTAFSWSYSRFS